MCRRPKRGTPREATTPCYLQLRGSPGTYFNFAIYYEQKSEILKSYYKAKMKYETNTCQLPNQQNLNS